MRPSVTPQTLRRLTYFVAIAEEGSIRGAAQRLRLSPPVVSSALSELEEDLATTLITRTTRRHELTSAGHAVLRHVTEMLTAATHAIEATQSDASLSGAVTVTLPSELTTHWLPPRLKAFRALHPDVAVSVQPEDAVVTLKAAPADIALRTRLMPLTAPMPPDHPLAFPLECVCANPPALNLKADGITLEMALIGSLGSDEAWLSAYHTKRSRTLRLDFASGLAAGSKAAALAMVREGLGAALLLAASVEEDLSAGRVKRLAPDLQFGWIEGEILFRDKLPSREARAFASHLTG